MTSRTLCSLLAAAAVAACTSSASERTPTGEGPAASPPAAAVDPAPAAVAPKAELTDEEYAARPRAALVGNPAPAATLPLLEGPSVSLAELAGKKPVYVEFWATWCVPCREQMPHLEQIHRTYGDRLAVFAINLGMNDPVETVRSFRDEHRLTVPIALDPDGALGELFQVSVTPQHILIDRAGVVRYVGHAASDELDAAIEAIVRDDGASAVPPRAAPEAAGPLALSLSDGATFQLAAQTGKPVALTFVKASCDTYLAESRPAMAKACMAHAREAERVRQANPSLVWITVVYPVWTTPATLEKYRQRTGAGGAMGIDEHNAWFHRFAVRDVPTTILLDRKGAEVRRITGPGEDLAGAISRLQ